MHRFPLLGVHYNPLPFQVWRAELILADFVLHKMVTSSEFDGIVAIELGAGTGNDICVQLKAYEKTNDNDLFLCIAPYVKGVNSCLAPFP